MDGFDFESLFTAHGEDAAGLFTSTITVLGLFVAGAFLSGVQLIAEPIECWCPAETSDAMCNYTKSLCWVSKLYVIDFDDAVPMNPEVRAETQQRQLQFYPMIAFTLLVLALLLKLPSFLWTAMQAAEGLNVSKAVQLAASHDKDLDQIGQDIAFEVSFNLTRHGTGRADHPYWRRVKTALSAFALFPLGGDVGTYQTGLFLSTRLLAMLILVLVFPGLSYVLQMDFLFWGWSLVRWVVMESEEPMNMFPLETLCDFRVRQQQNVQDFTVQCVLPINMWSEKVFLVLWFWLFVLLLLNLHSYQYWIRKLLVPSNRRALMAKHLAILEPDIKKNQRKLIADFTWNFMTHDSILVLRILELAAGSRLANVVVSHLWTDYNNRRKERHGPTYEHLSPTNEDSTHAD